jgi:hypothetical protein
MEGFGWGLEVEEGRHKVQSGGDDAVERVAAHLGIAIR